MEKLILNRIDVFKSLIFRTFFLVDETQRSVRIHSFLQVQIYPENPDSPIFLWLWDGCNFDVPRLNVEKQSWQGLEGKLLQVLQRHQERQCWKKSLPFQQHHFSQREPKLIQQRYFGYQPEGTLDTQKCLMNGWEGKVSRYSESLWVCFVGFPYFFFEIRWRILVWWIHWLCTTFAALWLKFLPPTMEENPSKRHKSDKDLRGTDTFPGKMRL